MIGTRKIPPVIAEKIKSKIDWCYNHINYFYNLHNWSLNPIFESGFSNDDVVTFNEFLEKTYNEFIQHAATWLDEECSANMLEQEDELVRILEQESQKLFAELDEILRIKRDELTALYLNIHRAVHQQPINPAVTQPDTQYIKSLKSTLLLQQLRTQIDDANTRMAYFANEVERTAFTNALNDLYHYLEVELPEAEEDKFFYATHPAVKVAEETIALLKNLNSKHVMPEQAKFSINKYKQNCYAHTNQYSILGKLVLTVAITALCAVTGFLIGVAIDGIFGFATLGAFGVVGFLKGVGTGAAVSTLLFGSVGFNTSVFNFFSHTELEQDYKAVLTTAEKIKVPNRVTAPGANNK